MTGVRSIFLYIKAEDRGDRVLSKPRLDIGDEVRINYCCKKKPIRDGRVVGIYERFFNVCFGRYQESFLWVDTMLEEIKVVRCGRQSGCQVS